ncbi:MAG TPA: hypothetical protein VMI11_06665 [Actinomycetes bacterium]|nr:hypothetical protein [Actinomycetes bacterium]
MDREHGIEFPSDGVRLEAVLEGRASELTVPERRLGALGAALRAPATPDELAGMAEALAHFREHQETSAAGAAWSRRAFSRVRPPLRVGAAAALFVVVGAGTATAATSGALPAPLQQFAHVTLGAPPHHPHHHRIPGLTAEVTASRHSAPAATSDPRTPARSGVRPASAVPTASPTPSPWATDRHHPRAHHPAGWHGLPGTAGASGATGDTRATGEAHRTGRSDHARRKGHHDAKTARNGHRHHRGSSGTSTAHPSGSRTHDQTGH